MEGRIWEVTILSLFIMSKRKAEDAPDAATPSEPKKARIEVVEGEDPDDIKDIVVMLTTESRDKESRIASYTGAHYKKVDNILLGFTAALRKTYLPLTCVAALMSALAYPNPTSETVDADYAKLHSEQAQFHMNPLTLLVYFRLKEFTHSDVWRVHKAKDMNLVSWENVHHVLSINMDKNGKQL
jgi:hypothetical protein